MTTFRTIVIALVVATASAGAGIASADPPKAEKKPAKAADKPASKPAGDDKATLSDAEVKRVVEFFDKLLAIAVASKDDCAKMASTVTAHLEANKALLKEIADAKSQHRELPPDVKEELARRTAQELAPAMMAKCRKDRQVNNAFTRLQLMTTR